MSLNILLNYIARAKIISKCYNIAKASERKVFCMNKTLKLPVGIENFEEIRKDGFYYVDKTTLIEQLLNQWAKVTLFTRPRRFGKTLNMSMLSYFFSIGTDKALFDGLYISQNLELCEAYMGKYPVIFLTLKGAEGVNFAAAKSQLVNLIADEAGKFSFLRTSSKLTAEEKEQYAALVAMQNGKYAIDDDILTISLKKLSELLYKHYGQKTVILLDEYDVPLDKAFQNGYYKEMVSLVRAIFGNALKTNDYLKFAVLTGCLRVSKESIFTGLNNFKVLTITDARLDEQFGFTEAEVRELLHHYNLDEHLAETKAWYDGYRFGNADIYCPWDVINHVDLLRFDASAEPQSYWSNSSGNDLVKGFISKASRQTKDELETLVAGGNITKEIHQELTYDEIDTSIDNLWSVLFTTGYLTLASKESQGIYTLKIPNEEIRQVYKQQIQEWFKRSIKRDTKKLEAFWHNLEAGNAAAVEAYITSILINSISILDIKGNDDARENSYHMLLLALLAANAEWLTLSNVEAGTGFADIIIKTEHPDAGIIIELKHAQSYIAMENSCENALAQIDDRQYVQYLTNDDRHDVIAYGIAFHKKKCRVLAKKLTLKS